MCELILFSTIRVKLILPFCVVSINRIYIRYIIISKRLQKSKINTPEGNAVALLALYCYNRETENVQKQ